MISLLLEFLKTTLFIAVVLQGSFYRTFCVGKIMLSLSLSIALSELPRRYDLIRVVTLHAAGMASGSLTYLVGCSIASDDQAPIGYLERPMTQPKGSVSVRRIFPMTAITLIKAWIAFSANKW